MASSTRMWASIGGGALTEVEVVADGGKVEVFLVVNGQRGKRIQPPDADLTTFDDVKAAAGLEDPPAPTDPALASGENDSGSAGGAGGSSS